MGCAAPASSPLPPQPPLPLPCILKVTALQDDDFIPEKLGAPDALPRLLGLAGEPIHCHLHVGVDSRLAVVHLGLC